MIRFWAIRHEHHDAFALLKGTGRLWLGDPANASRFASRDAAQMAIDTMLDGFGIPVEADG